MTDRPVIRDERAVAVANASYVWAFVVLQYGLLVSVMVRSLVLKEASWDLLALVVVSGGVATFYQASRRTLSRRWVKTMICIGLIAAIVGFVVAMAMTLMR